MFYPTEYQNNAENSIKMQIKQEKRNIRKASNFLGVAYLIMMSVMSYWYILPEFVADYFSVDPRRLKEILYDSTIMPVIQITVSSIAFLLSFFLYTRFMKVRLSDIGSFNKPKRKDLLFPFVLLGLGVCGFSNAVTNLAGSLFLRLGFQYTPSGTENPANIYGIILSFVATAVTPALVEEFALRGAVLGTFRKYGEGFAVIISSVIFGLMHRNFAQLPFALILGFVFGYAVIKTGTIWTAVIIHFLNNFISVLLDFVLEGQSVQQQYIVNWGYFAVLMIIGFVGFAMLHKKGERNFELDNSGGLLNTGDKLKVFFFSPLIIISVVVTLIDCIAEVF